MPAKIIQIIDIVGLGLFNALGAAAVLSLGFVGLS